MFHDSAVNPSLLRNLVFSTFFGGQCNPFLVKSTSQSFVSPIETFGRSV